MDLKRFFTDTLDEEFATLTGSEFIHAVKVVRLKVGYKLIVCNNTPYDYYGEVCSIEKDSLLIKIEKKVWNDTELSKNVTLYIGNNKELDTVVQKAVEMGVKRIVPFFSQHCNCPTINETRLKTIVAESSKQCGRSILAEVSPLLPFSEALADMKGTKCAFYEYERENKVADVPMQDEDISVVIGCEGGFSQEETEAMRQNGCRLLTLGKRILRVSTAVVSACTLINERMDG